MTSKIKSFIEKDFRITVAGGEMLSENFDSARAVAAFILRKQHTA